MDTRSFQDQVADMWRTRPVRLPKEGHIAGVCSGIGVRYGVDPVLIRVVFVASALFGGGGLVLYLAAWLMFPRHGDQVSSLESLVGRGASSDSTTKVVVLLVALAIAAGAIGPVGAGSGGSGSSERSCCSAVGGCSISGVPNRRCCRRPREPPSPPRRPFLSLR